MSYRMTIGFDDDAADFCVPRDESDMEEVVLRVYAYGAKVSVLNDEWRQRFLESGWSVLDEDLSRFIREVRE